MSIKDTFYNIGFKIKKNKPEILLAMGIASGIAATVTACFATRKIDAITEEAKKDIDYIEVTARQGECIIDNKLVPYTEEDKVKDIAITKRKMVGKLVVNYAVPVALQVASIACIIGSYKEQKARNIALATSLTAMTTFLSQYRERVANEVGHDREIELYTGTDTVEVTEMKEDGTTETKNVKVVGEDAPYTFIWDEHSATNEWDKDYLYASNFIKCKKAQMEDMINVRKRLFLNDALTMLGFNQDELVPEGQEIGWELDPENPYNKNKVNIEIIDVTDYDACSAYHTPEPKFLIVCNELKPLLTNWKKKKEND